MERRPTLVIRRISQVALPAFVPHNPDQLPTPKRSQEGSRSASLTVKVLVFVVPALVGFMVAYSAIQLVSPFNNLTEWLAWVGVALVVSMATSLFVGDVFRRMIGETRLSKRANAFDTQVEQVFGETLRAGSPRNIRKSAVRSGQDAKGIDQIMELLERVGRHDRLTRGHSERVRAYATLIGNEIGLEEEEMTSLGWSSLMHDIGKLDVPNWLLNTPEKPNAEEMQQLERHCESATNRLRRVEKYFGPKIYDAALYHHEQWDGSGYPHGLAGEDIPLFGRIAAIADVFDVMTHARSYKEPLPTGLAREELERGAGTQFDPKLVAAFLRIGDEQLNNIRSWAASAAGVAWVGSRVAAMTAHLALGAAAVGGAAAVAGGPPAEMPPPQIAFAEPSTTTTTAAPTTTTTAAPSTTTAAPTTTATPTTTPTTIATTTTTTTIATTTTAPRFLTVNYQIGTNEIDGVIVTVDADELHVFLDGELHQTIELTSDQRAVPVVFDVTNLAPGAHEVRFDLYLNDSLLSSDTTAIVV